MTLIRTALATAALMAGVGAQAATSLYLNEADYLAAVGPTLAYTDFAGSPGQVVSGAGFLPEVAFVACGVSCDINVFHASDAITDVGGSNAPNGVGSLGGFFFAPVSAFAFHYVSGAIASVVLADGSILDTSAATGFIGIVGNPPHTGFLAINAVFPATGGNDRYFLDDFRINAPVPEPSSWLMLAAGGLLLTQRLRRRARG